MNKLIFFPTRYPQESSLSLLIRCATANGYQDLKNFSLAWNLRLNSITGSQWKGSHAYKLLTRDNSLSPSERASIEEAFYRRLRPANRSLVDISGVLFPATMLRTQLNLCPACIRNGYLDSMHTLRFSNVCPSHGEQYINACPHCDQALDWLRLRDFHCPCGFDLRKAPSVACDTTASRLIKNAILDKDETFFTLLLSSMSAIRHFHTPSSQLQLMEVCVNIASGNKSTYFREMQKLQRFFPSLHRRALLAPFILSANQTLSSYAIEYFFNTHQTKPTNHQRDCCCGELQFTNPELIFIFKTFNQVTQLKAEKLCIRAGFLLKPTANKKLLFQCPDLCMTLTEESYGDWEPRNRTATPEADFKLINCPQAAKILRTTAANIKHLINAGIIKGFKLHYPGGPRTSLLSIKAFNDKYILRSEIAKQTGLSDAKLREILKKTTPLIIHGFPYARNIPIYSRTQLPSELTTALNTKNNFPTRTITDGKSLLTFSQAAEQLKLDLKDISQLIKIGILQTVFVPNQTEEKGRDYCTGESVTQAKVWRKGYLTVQEAALSCHSNGHMLHSHFLSTGFIKPLALKKTFLINLEDVTKIAHHLKTYTCPSWLVKEYNYPLMKIVRLIESGGIQPLTPGDSNFIVGRITIPRLEAKNIITLHISKKYDTNPQNEKPD